MSQAIELSSPAPADLEDIDIGEAHPTLDRRLSYEETAYGSYRVELAAQAKRLAASSRRSRSGSLLDSLRAHRPSSNADATLQWHTLLLLLLLGLVAGALDYAIASGVDGLQRFREHVGSQIHPVAEFFWGVLLTTTFVAAAVAWTRGVGPLAAGSGIPEMKTELGGATISQYLSTRTLVSKVVGLVFALGSGLSIGKEGPFVHISSCVAAALLRMRFFAEAARSKYLRLQVLGAACAVGISSSFRSPIGGVLFSIEVTSSYYNVANYAKAFASATSAAVIVKLIAAAAEEDARGPLAAEYETAFDSSPFYVYELPLFVALGVFGGVLGGLSVRLMEKSIELRRQHLNGRGAAVQLWLYPVCVAVATAAFNYLPGEYARKSFDEVIPELFGDLGGDWTGGSVYASLLVFMLGHALLTPLSITLPLPCGCFVPSFATGAAMGRLVGEAVADAFPDAEIEPAGYAVVGAVALTSGYTRTVSAAVIAVELTGQANFVLPMLVAALAACATGAMFSDSVYDSMLRKRSLPFLPHLSFASTLTAGDIMHEVPGVLARASSVAALERAMEENPAEEAFPVVDDLDSRLLLGTVSRGAVGRVIARSYELAKLPVPAAYVGGGGGGSGGGRSTTRMSLRGMFDAAAGGSGRVDETAVVSLGTSESSDPAQRGDDRERPDVTVDLAEDDDLVVRAAGFTLSADSPVSDVHVLFCMLRCKQLYCVSTGALVGAIGAEDLLASSDE